LSTGSGAFVLGSDVDGDVAQCLQDSERRYVAATGVLERGGCLHLGSVVEPCVARIPQSSR
jgi:hypothetical protein